MLTRFLSGYPEPQRRRYPSAGKGDDMKLWIIAAALSLASCGGGGGGGGGGDCNYSDTAGAGPFAQALGRWNFNWAGHCDAGSMTLGVFVNENPKGVLLCGTWTCPVLGLKFYDGEVFTSGQVLSSWGSAASTTFVLAYITSESVTAVAGTWGIPFSPTTMDDGNGFTAWRP